MIKLYRIGELTELLSLSADTLRYYEKIKLLPRIHRASSGVRLYNDKDISKLKFIKRAQKMNFSLSEIKKLLSMRENPQHARISVRTLTHQKLDDTESCIKDLKLLRNELKLLLNLCTASEDGCPIIEGIEKSASKKRKKH